VRVNNFRQDRSEAIRIEGAAVSLRQRFSALFEGRPALLDLLADASGLEARDLPVPAALIRFPHRMPLGGDAYVNAGDAPGRVLRLSWDARSTTPELERRPLTDPLLRAAWGAHLSRLTLVVRRGPARVRLERVP
jgi:hypothetical protein